MTDPTLVPAARRAPRSEAYDFALDVVRAMAMSGQAVVPAKPTRAMLEAGAKAGDVTTIAARKIYTAMIGAA